jgi:hypothetical protein
MDMLVTAGSIISGAARVRFGADAIHSSWHRER